MAALSLESHLAPSPVHGALPGSFMLPVPIVLKSSSFKGIKAETPALLAMFLNTPDEENQHSKLNFPQLVKFSEMLKNCYSFERSRD